MMKLTTRPHFTLRRALVAGALCLGFVACGTPETAPQSPQGLADITIPDGFDFATTRPVALQVRTQRTDQVAVEVENDLGHVIYRGPLSADQPLQRSFSLPTAAKTVTVVLVDGPDRESATVAIRDAQATHQF